jgi:hypothetical protein
VGLNSEIIIIGTSNGMLEDILDYMPGFYGKTRRVVPALLIKCDECSRSQLIQEEDMESPGGWQLFNGKDLCSNECFWRAINKIFIND